MGRVLAWLREVILSLAMRGRAMPLLIRVGFSWVAKSIIRYLFAAAIYRRRVSSMSTRIDTNLYMAVVNRTVSAQVRRDTRRMKLKRVLGFLALGARQWSDGVGDFRICTGRMLIVTRGTQLDIVGFP
jgi:hypothetical protein